MRGTILHISLALLSPIESIRDQPPAPSDPCDHAETSGSPGLLLRNYHAKHTPATG